MRKVILQMAMSLDGMVTGPNGEMDWIFSASTKESREYIDKLLNSSDLILLGRGMAKEFLDYWPADTTEFGAKINRLPKVIFSKTMTEAKWPDVTIAKDIASEIARHEAQPGKNLILYGGAGLAQSFMKLGLIDEFHLIIVPIILGKGLSLFKEVNVQNLKLIHSKITSTGVLLNHYEPVR